MKQILCLWIIITQLPFIMAFSKMKFAVDARKIYSLKIRQIVFSNYQNSDFIDSSISFLNNAMTKFNSHLIMSNGGLDDVTSIILESYVEETSNVGLFHHTTLNELVNCKQIQMINERNEYVQAFYLSLSGNYPECEVETTMQSVIRTIKSLGLQCSFREGSNIIVDFGELSPSDFRILLIQYWKKFLQQHYGQLVFASEELLLLFDSCMNDLRAVEKAIIENLKTKD